MRAGRVALAGVLVLAAGCSAFTGDGPQRAGGDGVLVVTTTQILADLAREVGGDRVQVSSLVPDNGDPHSYEPVPDDVLRVAEADVTFTNHLLLEQQSLIETIDVNVPEHSLNVSLAESAETYGAHVIPLVENISLDVLWLGLRVRGEGEQYGADRTSQVVLTATDLTGPGDLVAYLTQALGQTERYVDSSDGLDATDTTSLPPAAHTHLSWAFTEPGVYELTLEAAVDVGDGEPQPVGSDTFRFAVGVEPRQHLEAGQTLLDHGHTDLTVDLDSAELYAYSDPTEGTGTDQVVQPADEVLIEVPNRAVETIPDGGDFDFLGAPGDQVWQLPQAVLGKHVHGEIDPHLWQDVDNAKAYVQLIRDTLIEADPEGAQEYEENASVYLERLTDLDGELAEVLDTLPEGSRQLVTTHDAFGYLADAYGLTVAGFVVPNPAQEPSVEDVDRLVETVTNLDVPAVFLEPNLAERSSVLRQVATDAGVQVCTIHSDAFGPGVGSYVQMMEHNAHEVARCLGGQVAS